MMMKRLFLMLALACTIALSAHADGNDYLTIAQNNGTLQSFKALGLKIVFADGNMKITQDNTTTTLSIADLSKMYFSATSGIEGTKTDANDTDICDIYDLQGRKIATLAPSYLRTTVPPGVYIVRRGNSSVKLHVGTK